MPRMANFSYQDPTAAIGSSLVEAIFGNPAKAAEQARIRAELDARAAQAERDRAAEGYDTERTRGAALQNTAADGLPALIARLQAPAQQVPSIDDPAFLEGVGTRRRSRPMPSNSPPTLARSWLRSRRCRVTR